MQSYARTSRAADKPLARGQACLPERWSALSAGYVESAVLWHIGVSQIESTWFAPGAPFEATP